MAKPKRERKRVIGGKEFTLLGGCWVRFVSGEEARLLMEPLEAQWAANYIALLGELPEDLRCWVAHEETPPPAAVPGGRG